jgi:hypothetical protein
LRKKAEQIKEFLLKYAVFDGKMVKHIWPAAMQNLPNQFLKVEWMPALIGIAVSISSF